MFTAESDIIWRYYEKQKSEMEEIQRIRENRINSLRVVLKKIID